MRDGGGAWSSSIAGKGRRGWPILGAVRRKIICPYGDRIPVPKVVNLVDHPRGQHVDETVAAAIEGVERIGAIHLDGELRQPLWRIGPRPGGREQPVEVDIADVVQENLMRMAMDDGHRIEF